MIDAVATGPVIEASNDREESRLEAIDRHLSAPRVVHDSPSRPIDVGYPQGQQ